MQFSPQAKTELSGLCDDAGEGAIINGSAEITVAPPDFGSITFGGASYGTTAAPGTSTSSTSVSNTSSPSTGFTDVTSDLYYKGDYVISEEPTQTISLNGGDEKEVVFENLKKPLLTISKNDADTQKPIPGTVFRVEAINGDYQDDWTTGTDGRVSFRVEPGTYRVTEKSVPAPYFLPDKGSTPMRFCSFSPKGE